MEGKLKKSPARGTMPKAPKPKYAGSIRKHYKYKEEKEWYFLCCCGKKGVEYYDYRPCIQCDVCKIWKHVKCVGFSEDVSKLADAMRKRRVWVCSDCKSGNFKFIAKIWLGEEQLAIDKNNIVQSLSENDDVTKTIEENAKFERDLKAKKKERNKKLVRKPTAFEEEYSQVSDEFFDQFDEMEEEEEVSENSPKQNDGVIDDCTERSPRDDVSDDKKSPRKEKNGKDEGKGKGKGAEKGKGKGVGRRLQFVPLKSFVYAKSKEDKNVIIHDQKNDISIVLKKKEQMNGVNNNNDDKDEKIVIGNNRISFTDEITTISEANAVNEPRHHHNIEKKSILKQPTPNFAEGPTLSSLSDYRLDPDNLTFKENPKQRIVRAGRSFIRTLSVY